MHVSNFPRNRLPAGLCPSAWGSVRTGLWLAACLLASASTSRAVDTDLFERQVRPLLADHCYECHSAKAAKLKAGLALDTVAGLKKGGTTGPLFTAGQPESSLLVQAVQGKAHDLEAMPPKGDKLTAAQIAILEDWIRRGAPMPAEAPVAAGVDPTKHWAFQKPVASPIPPPPAGVVPAANLIDAFIQAAQRQHGLTPADIADRRTFIRRASFDVTGLPPTPEETENFLADKSPEAFERVADRLLASPRYGERWARHWLDIARYADTKGYVFEEERRYPASFTYRDWVIGALNQDMPYDRFLVNQVAGDALVTAEDRTPLAALGFLTLGRRFLNNQPDIIDDRLDVIFRGVQGLTIGCARCHDHKFDPIPMADYYSLYGVFASSHEPDPKPLIGANPNTVQAAAYEAERLRRVKEREDFQAEKVEQARRELRDRIGEYLLAVQDARAAADKREELIRSRKLSPGLVDRWDKALEGWTREHHPIFAPYAAFRALPTNEFTAKAPALAQQFAANADPARPLNPLIAQLFATNPPASLQEVADRYGVRFKQVNAEWQKRLAASAEAKVPAPTSIPEADWEALRRVLYAEDSPVMVNWDTAYRLVPTPDQQKFRALQRKLDELDATHPGAPLRAMAMADNGTPVEPVIFKRGNPGNHGPKVPRQFLGILDPKRQPFTKGSGRLELGESLASRDNPLTARVMVNRVWLEYFGNPLVRTPSDFGVRTDPPTHPELLDWMAVWFMDHGWSLKQLQRLILTSEAYRRTSDPAPSAAVAENERKDPSNTYLWRMNRKRADFEAMRDALLFVSGRLDLSVGGQAVEIYNDNPANRRTIYGFIDRQNLPGVLRSFDFASPDTSSSMRFRTTVPQQALYLLNSPFAADMSRQFAARPDVAGAATEEDRIRRLYAHAFQREPGVDELVAARNFLREAAVSQPAAVPTPIWEYGFGRFDTNTSRVQSFTPFKQFANNQWQAAAEYPVGDARGYAALSATGGHPGRDLGHSVIRRWHAPVSGVVHVRGKVKHPSPNGDGVIARLVSSRAGALGEWKAAHGDAPARLSDIRVEAGETLDFVLECGADDNSDSFEWAPEITLTAASAAGMTGRSAWNAKADFSGPLPPRRPLSPWERYAQALLASNEFIFID